jgi:hypothetical protein
MADPDPPPRVGSGPFAVALADLDGDDVLDAAFLDATPQLCTLHGQNNGKLTLVACVPLTEAATALGVAALGPGKSMSLLTAGRQLTVFSVGPSLTPVAPIALPLTGTATALQVAAVAPCDGSPDPCCGQDILVSDGTAGEVAVYFANTGCDGSLRGPQRFAVGSDPVAVTWADLDGDGAGELATANQGMPPLTVLGPRGVATFTGCTQPALRRPSALLALDLDHDGGRVLVLADEDDASLRLLRVLQPTGPLSLDCGDAAGERIPVAADPRALAAADLNGDGTQDLVVAHGSPPALGVLLGGAGTLDAELLFPLGVALRGVAVRALHRDARPPFDIAVASSGDGTIRVLRSAYR